MSLDFDPDGDRLVVVDSYERCSLLNVQTGGEITNFDFNQRDQGNL